MRECLSMKTEDCNFNRRSGILVLINEVDWELEGEYQYNIIEGDTISFISTLHGG